MHPISVECTLCRFCKFWRVPCLLNFKYGLGSSLALLCVQLTICLQDCFSRLCDHGWAHPNCLRCSTNVHRSFSVILKSQFLASCLGSIEYWFRHQLIIVGMSRTEGFKELRLIFTLHLFLIVVIQIYSTWLIYHCIASRWWVFVAQGKLQTAYSQLCQLCAIGHRSSWLTEGIAGAYWRKKRVWPGDCHVLAAHSCHNGLSNCCSQSSK